MIKILLSIILCLGSVAQASFHVSDHADKDFVALGQNYPAVGTLSFEDGAQASGVLVDVTCFGPDFTHLQGRVVLTAAHSFEDYLESDEPFPLLTFQMEGEEARPATVHMHPIFVDFYKKHGYGQTSYDIAVMILDKPVNQRGAQLSLDMSFEDMLDHYYVSVGYGLSGHILSENAIMDCQKRASFAYASGFQDNVHLDSTIICFEEGERKEVPVHSPKGSFLKLYPYVQDWLSEKPIISQDKVTGVAGSGDSGGGVFDENGFLVGVTSSSGCAGSSVHWFIEHDVYEKSPRIQESFYEKHAFYKEECDRLKNQPEELAMFLRHNTDLQSLSVFQKEDNIEHLFKSTKDIRSLDDVWSSLSSDATIIAFHTDWILETLHQIQK